MRRLYSADFSVLAYTFSLAHYIDSLKCIGVEYYEDFQEKMSRSQVEAIAEIVKAAVHERFPSAEIEIMGSYRRGKEACGDVDIMIFHPDYVDKVPERGLGKIVDSLHEKGHIEHHLTFIGGMDPAKFDQSNPRTKDKPDQSHVSSYMGVFCVDGKRRHVSIAPLAVAALAQPHCSLHTNAHCLVVYRWISNFIHTLSACMRLSTLPATASSIGPCASGQSKSLVSSFRTMASQTSVAGVSY